MVRDSFVAFILSHGRCDNVQTVDTLKRCGYTGKWLIVLDDEDTQIEDYKNKFGAEHIVVFSKKDIAKEFDIMDNFEGNKVITYARNAVNHIAKDLGFDYFWELEDDYRDFCIRLEVGKHLPIIRIEDLDSIIELYLTFLDKTNIKTVAFAQTGEMMGGCGGEVWRSKVKRKAMNTFFFRTENSPMTIGDQFIGRMNDDVNWYITAGRTGKVILQTANCSLTQELTQQSKSGNTITYKAFGTYVKSFYSVMLRPDCVKISMLGTSVNTHKTDYRIHHKIDWKYCVPKIISSRFKKEVN